MLVIRRCTAIVLWTLTLTTKGTCGNSDNMHSYSTGVTAGLGKLSKRSTPVGLNGKDILKDVGEFHPEIKYVSGFSTSNMSPVQQKLSDGDGNRKLYYIIGGVVLLVLIVALVGVACFCCKKKSKKKKKLVPVTEEELSAARLASERSSPSSSKPTAVAVEPVASVKRSSDPKLAKKEKRHKHDSEGHKETPKESADSDSSKVESLLYVKESSDTKLAKKEKRHKHDSEGHKETPKESPDSDSAKVESLLYVKESSSFKLAKKEKRHKHDSEGHEDKPKASSNSDNAKVSKKMDKIAKATESANKKSTNEEIVVATIHNYGTPKSSGEQRKQEMREETEEKSSSPRASLVEKSDKLKHEMEAKAEEGNSYKMAGKEERRHHSQKVADISVINLPRHITRNREMRHYERGYESDYNFQRYPNQRHYFGPRWQDDDIRVFEEDPRYISTRLYHPYIGDNYIREERYNLPRIIDDHRRGETGLVRFYSDSRARRSIPNDAFTYYGRYDIRDQRPKSFRYSPSEIRYESERDRRTSYQAVTPEVDSRFKEPYSPEVRQELRATMFRKERLSHDLPPLPSLREHLAKDTEPKYKKQPKEPLRISIPEPDYQTTIKASETKQKSPTAEQPNKSSTTVIFPREFKGPYGPEDLDEMNNPYPSP